MAVEIKKRESRYVCWKARRGMFICLATVTLLWSPKTSSGQAGPVVTIVGAHQLLETASRRVHEALASADGDAANRLNQIEITLTGLMRELEQLEQQGVKDLNKARDNFTQDALATITRASTELSSVSANAANSLNDTLLEAELTLDSVPFVRVKPHLLGQKPYVLRKPATGDVEVELVGYFPIGVDNRSKYPIRLRARQTKKEIPLNQTRFGHYSFVIPKGEAQSTFRYELIFPARKRVGGLFGVDYETDVGTVAVGKAMPFQFLIRYLRGNPAASAQVVATRRWQSQTIRNGELPNGVTSAKDLFSACVENPAAYDLRSVRIASLGTPQFALTKSCGSCGNASGELVSWNADEVKYRLRAPRTGAHQHTSQRGFRIRYTAVPQGTNRSAALILQPTFTATRLSSPAMIPLTDQVAKSEEEDVRDIDASLPPPWNIDITCVYDNGVQQKRSAVSLTPDNPQRTQPSWRAEYDGRRLRIVTF